MPTHPAIYHQLLIPVPSIRIENENPFKTVKTKTTTTTATKTTTTNTNTNNYNSNTQTTYTKPLVVEKTTITYKPQSQPPPTTQYVKPAQPLVIENQKKTVETIKTVVTPQITQPTQRPIQQRQPEPQRKQITETKTTTTTGNTYTKPAVVPAVIPTTQRPYVTSNNFPTPAPQVAIDDSCPCRAGSNQQQSSFTKTSTTTTTSSSAGRTPLLNNPQNQQFTTSSGYQGQANFGSIMNSMSLLQQLPVVPQVPGHPAFYAPDQLPKGAVIAFMPVVILPEAAYANCDDAGVHGEAYQGNIDPFPLGVQPAAIPAGFSLNSLFTGAQRKDQCMCPCSCTQKLPSGYQQKKKRDAVPAPLEPLVDEAALVQADASEHVEQIDEKPESVAEISA